MDLTTLYKEQIYKKKKRKKKAWGKKKHCHFPTAKSLPLALIPLLLLVSFCPYYARAFAGKKSHNNTDLVVYIFVFFIIAT